MSLTKIDTSLIESSLRTMPVPAGAMRPALTNGCASLAQVETTAGRPDIVSLDFDASTQEYAMFSVSMPKGWDEGTVTARFVWSHANTTTNFGVVWQIEAVAVGDNETIDVAYGTAVTVADTGGTEDNQYKSAVTSAITIGGTPQAEDRVYFRVSRKVSDGSDTMAIDARLMEVVIFATINTLDDA